MYEYCTVLYVECGDDLFPNAEARSSVRWDRYRGGEFL